MVFFDLLALVHLSLSNISYILNKTMEHLVSVSTFVFLPSQGKYHRAVSKSFLHVVTHCLTLKPTVAEVQKQYSRLYYHMLFQRTTTFIDFFPVGMICLIINIYFLFVEWEFLEKWVGCYLWKENSAAALPLKIHLYCINHIFYLKTFMPKLCLLHFYWRFLTLKSLFLKKSRKLLNTYPAIICASSYKIEPKWNINLLVA